MKIVPLDASFLSSAFEFSERLIGEGYFSREELLSIIEKSTLSTAGEEFKSCSFLGLNESGEVIGIRLTFPPRAWDHKTRLEKFISPELWKVEREGIAYFQSIFLSKESRGTGLGQKLSLKSIEALKEVGTKAILCHSWKESPGNSSQRYLEKLGFEVVREHPLFWADVDYDCTSCDTPSCSCTATEMIKYL